MAQYTPIFEKPYENGYENLPSQTTPITAETLNDKDDAIVNIESYLSQNDIPTYEEHTNTSGEFKTLSGGILSSCVVNLELIQSGSGTPSPQNVRPITGHTAVEVDVTDADSNTTQYTVALGQTVYGGSLDVVSGVLTVDKGTILMDGSQTLTIGSYNRAYYVISGAKYVEGTVNPIVICECLKQSTWSDIANSEGCSSPYGQGGIAFKIDNYTTAQQYVDYFTAHPTRFVYELVTPLTIQLTPQQINTLIGENHLDVPLEGQSLESLSYREMFAWDDVNDVVKAVDDKNADVSAIGTDESGNTTASKAYAVGEHFYKDGKFCTAKTAIASGATFTLNTNYVEGTIAQAISEKIGYYDLDISGVTINQGPENGWYYKSFVLTSNLPTNAQIISIEWEGNWTGGVFFSANNKTNMAIFAQSSLTLGSNRKLRIYYFIP